VAALRSAGAQYCSADAVQAACDSVLFITTHSGSAADVQSKLLDTAAFATVDTFDASSGTPTASQLAAYHAVLVSNPGAFLFSDAALLGNRLADYHDQGGGVVVAALANYAGSRLQGAYGTAANGYALMDYASGGLISPPDSLGDVLEAQSPLLTDVASLAAGEAYRSTASVIDGRGIVVARWRGGGGEPLVLRGSRGNRSLVELNFYPASRSAAGGWWTGDGAMLLRNALKYSRCMLRVCSPGTFLSAGDVCCAGDVCTRGVGRYILQWTSVENGGKINVYHAKISVVLLLKISALVLMEICQ
jgi:hypothetical protein